MRFLLALAVLVAGCRRKELTTAEACQRLERLLGAEPDGGWTDADRQGCPAYWEALNEPTRACRGRCLTESKATLEYEDCVLDCAGKALTPVQICVHASDAGVADSPCVGRFVELEKRRPAAFTCMSRCVRRGERACEASCGL